MNDPKTERLEQQQQRTDEELARLSQIDEPIHYGGETYTHVREIPKDLGATGDFPDGKLNAEDKGGVKIGITHQKGQVIVHFGPKIGWIGMAPSMAIKVAESLKENARKVVKKG